MTVSAADLRALTEGHMAGTYDVTNTRGVPMPEDIGLGAKAHSFEATSLFVDLRQSSAITNAFRRQTAAKMLKAYFEGTVRIIKMNGGEVRSFNGDGMLALFIGPAQADQAVKAAMQMKWFVRQVLQPQFNGLFTAAAKRGTRLDFSTGCGIDSGIVYAVRVGMKGTNDIAWVGRGTNTAAKLSNLLHHPRSIGVTGVVYDQLSEQCLNSNGKAMWSSLIRETFGGAERHYRTTTYHWSVA